MWLPIESRLLLNAATAAVPRPLRSDWRREWEARLWCSVQGLPNAGHTPLERLQVFGECCSAVKDAFRISRSAEGWGDRLRQIAGAPWSWVAAACLILLLLAAATGGFQRTRQALITGPIPGAMRTAVLSQSSTLFAGRFGVPARKVEYWNQQARTIEGAAVYVWYSTLAGRDAAHLSEYPAAKVGPRFFELLGAHVLAGRLFNADDANACTDCVVLAYDFWRREFRGDRSVVGRTIFVDARPARITGIVAGDFWFLDVAPAVWTLYRSGVTWPSFPDVLGGAVCRLKPGVAPMLVEAELRALAKQVKPARSGTSVVVTPLREITSRPVTILGPVWVALVSFSFLFALALWAGMALRGQSRWGALKYPGFLLLKAVLALTIVLLATAELCAGAFLTRLGGTVFAGGIASLWAGLVASAVALYVCWRDQRKRCRICLQRLTMPVRMGYGARQLFEQSGAETVCMNGHGTLFESEGGPFPPEYRWAPLDISWRDLFRTPEKTKQ